MNKKLTTSPPCPDTERVHAALWRSGHVSRTAAASSVIRAYRERSRGAPLSLERDFLLTRDTEAWSSCFIVLAFSH